VQAAFEDRFGLHRHDITVRAPHRSNGGVKPRRCGLPYAHPGDDLAEQLRAVAVRVNRADGAAVLLQPVNVLIDKRHDLGIKCDRTVTGGSTLAEHLNQRVFSELAVLIEIVSGTASLDDAGHSVVVAVAAPRDPHPAAQVSAGDLAVDGVVAGYQQMVSTRYRKPNVCIMHPRRWLSGFANAVDMQGRPLMLPSTHPAALVGTADDGVVAEWLGMRVVLDTNIPITSGTGSQDYVILGHSPDWLLYESLPNFEVNKGQLAAQMSVELIAWQYAALAVRYPSSVCLVGPFDPPTTPGS
jgi:hypothetical protein